MKKKKEVQSSHRQISISEFFSKNEQLLGFENPSRVLLIAVKEAVDNSLDACEDARILPCISVVLTQEGDLFRLAVADNGPGIDQRHVPKVFGSLLFGSKFHKLKQSRGQQGIGISAVCLYSYLKTNEPARIVSRVLDQPAFETRLIPDIETNEPKVLSTKEIDWPVEHGVMVEMLLKGSRAKGPWSVQEYLRQTALANPSASFALDDCGERENYPALTDQLPTAPKEIQPHPAGLDVGTFINTAHAAQQRTLNSFLVKGLSGVSLRLANLVAKKAELSSSASLGKLSDESLKRIFKALQETQLLPPPKDCISPIGDEQLRLSLSNLVKADFITANTRKVEVYHGIPFAIETALAYCHSLPEGKPGVLYRFANKIPLLYREGSCALTQGAKEVEWRSYLASQTVGLLPERTVLMIHLLSPRVPYLSEAKDSVADFAEIIREVKLSCQACGRDLKRYIRHTIADAEDRRKLDYKRGLLPT